MVKNTDSIKNTFGYKLYTERNNAKMTPGDLADKMNELISADYEKVEYSSKIIREWEANKNLPDSEAVNKIVEAICRGRAENKNKLTPTEKLQLTLDLTQSLLKTHELKDGITETRTSFFADKFKENLEKYKISESRFIDLLNKRGSPPVKLTAHDIYLIENNRMNPPDGFIQNIGRIFTKLEKDVKTEQGFESPFIIRSKMAEIVKHYEIDNFLSGCRGFGEESQKALTDPYSAISSAVSTKISRVLEAITDDKKGDKENNAPYTKQEFWKQFKLDKKGCFTSGGHKGVNFKELVDSYISHIKTEGMGHARK